MTKMAAMPIYGKNLKDILRNQKGDDLETTEYYHVCSNDDPVLTWTYFRARSNLVPYALNGEKVKQWIFQKLFQSMISKLVDIVS